MEPNVVNPNEIDIIKIADSSAIGITRNGPVTSAAIAVGEFIGIGIARCNPKDKPSQEIGDMIATWRAIEDYSRKQSQLWVGRAVTQEEWDAKHSTK